MPLVTLGPNPLLVWTSYMHGPPREVGMLTMGPACAISSAVAVAVGGGGQNYDAHDDGGSGSGYVEFLEFNVSAALMQFEAVVGSGTIAK